MVTLKFKSHRNSTRIYTVTAPDDGSGHFVAAALRAANWIVVSVERTVVGSNGE